jgi:hypothetical protein
MQITTPNSSVIQNPHNESSAVVPHRGAPASGSPPLPGAYSSLAPYSPEAKNGLNHPAASGQAAESHREERGIKLKPKPKAPPKPATNPKPRPAPKPAHSNGPGQSDSIAGSAFKGAAYGAGSTAGSEGAEKIKELIVGKAPETPEEIEKSESAAQG